MLSLRYYCKGRAEGDLRTLLAEVKAKHGIAYEILDLSKHGEYDEAKEKGIYERDFKPRAKVLGSYHQSVHSYDKKGG